ncbi:hypothetical protein CYR55_22525 [Chimaeribacter californicus]|uniref:Uncharacterized protein n=1 Tax=Chimaeribacter californicus TaxID=2060067 RepID=A0A2N5DTT1_9GAMM|nr:hypothetical protein [Chimaeribacter californicus]PLR29959.1 hypothetical protein CYR55_22525 [Chimaeribacter californicus]
MKGNFFQSGALRSDGLTAFAMGAKAPEQPMLESVTNNAPPAEEPKKEITLEEAHQMILEKAAAAVATNQLADAAQAVFSWADGDDHSYDALDGYAQAEAGIGDDTDPTDDQLDAYFTVLGNMADFMVAAGADEDAVQALFDDEDDDIAGSLGTEFQGLDDADRSELITAYSLSADDSMVEAVEKVVRKGKVVLIRKPFKKHHMTSAQRMALKKARSKAFTAQAKLHRAKSMKLRAKRIGR